MRALLSAIVLIVLLLAGNALASELLIKIDRHDELKDESIKAPVWPEDLPTPLTERAYDLFYIVIENREGGTITVYKDDSSEIVGSVLSPVSDVNKKGFTASGWAEIGTVCASAVNAIHLKTDHDYGLGRGTIFSLLPIEQAKVDPNNYKSYLSHSTSIQTDIKGGNSIFGGRWAPIVGSVIRSGHIKGAAMCAPVEPGWVPSIGETITLEVKRRKYNPEYIEFANSYGGLIMIKELGKEPYPIGQVLKPVVGIGRFLGTQYADVGRIRASHPGVICISTSKMNEVGGFQIIPRDHAMSPEMIYTRYKTQWMVVGPLWALDPSWEGLPPLFSDYLYPAFIPSRDEYGDPIDDIDPLEMYCGRFTVRGRYSDSDNPEEYRLLREEEYLDHYALKNLTHIRIYFPCV